MPRILSPSQRVADQLKAAGAKLDRTKALVGLDGFVDTILHVVAQRESATKFTRLTAMREFASRIDQAAGLSANIELVTQMVKLGGNGPIMANALDSYGVAVTYIGNLGAPKMHPVFADFARRAKVHSIAEPGYTDAVEFDDGKLMCGKHESLKEVNWTNLIDHLSERALLEIIARSELIALVNWTMLTHMDTIWRKLLTRIAPRLRGDRRWLFIDLADPAKRSRHDLANALKLVSQFERYFRVVLGLNLNESRQVGEVLGFPPPEETYGTITHHAGRLRDALMIDTVVIHPTHFAAAADRDGSTYAVGPFTAQPKITTGAGDHFNAGFCVGRLLGLDLFASLQLGTATLGFYVRAAKSPGLKEVSRFLRRF